MTKRVLALCLTLCMLLAILAGCGSQSATEPEPAQTETAAVSEAEAVELNQADTEEAAEPEIPDEDIIDGGGDEPTPIPSGGDEVEP